jgi:predicted ArsR family transcriptional regulator
MTTLDPDRRAVYQVLLDAAGKLAAADIAAVTGVKTRRVQGILTQLSADKLVQRLPQKRTDAPTVHVWWLSPSGRGALNRTLLTGEAPRRDARLS